MITPAASAAPATEPLPDAAAGPLPEWPAHWGMDTDAPSYFGYEEDGESFQVFVEPDTELVATQRLLHAHPAFAGFDPVAATSPERPQIVAMGGVAYINDGHHRLAAAAAADVRVEVDVWQTYADMGEGTGEDWDD